MSTATRTQRITVDRDRVTELVRQGGLAGVDEDTLTGGEDARALLEEAINKNALNEPDGLAVVVESENDDEDGYWIRLILTTDRPGGLEYSKGWDKVTGELIGGILAALEYAAAELNEILALVDPRDPSTREALIRVMRALSKDVDMPGADRLSMELAARYQISDADIAGTPR
jgi:hypothetical protein